ncbi:hypothetical protein XA1311A_06290 [Xanthomonas arboricola]|nr:hypothetical protein XA1311A_06290 [Xanthomonas arboricola]CAE6709076.1 hypothetical protein XA1311A_06290 [Xanthomonas arboricola]
MVDCYGSTSRPGLDAVRCGDVLPTSRHRGASLEAHTIAVRTPLTAHRAQRQRPRLRLRPRCDCGCAVTAAAWLWLWLWLWLTADSGTTTPARSPSPALRGKLRFQLDRSSPTGEDRPASSCPDRSAYSTRSRPWMGSDRNEKRRASRRFSVHHAMAAVSGSKRRRVSPAGRTQSPHQARLPAHSERRSDGADGAPSTAVQAWTQPIPDNGRAHLTAAQPFCRPLRAHACMSALSPARVRPAVAAGSGFAAAPAPATGVRHCRPRAGCSAPAGCSSRSWSPR